MHKKLLLAVGAAALFTAPLLMEPALAQAPAPQGQGQGQGAKPPEGGQGGAQGQGGRGVQGGGAQGIVGGAAAGGQGQGGRGGRGGRGGPPPGPAPRDANGRAMLNGSDIKGVGLWTPRGVSITATLAPVEQVPFQPWARALWEDREKHELEPHTRCKASGTARQFMTPYGVEIVEIPDVQRVYIFDVGGPHTFRTIYMDGRSHPARFSPTYYGHSIGWWEGDTLVVDSIGFNEDFWIDRRGLPHTNQLHTIERFTRTDSNTIRYEITIDDPGAYTKPWNAGFSLNWQGGQELFEYVCQQANYADELMVGDRDSVDRSSSFVP